MRNQWLKDLYFNSVQPLARVNSWRWQFQLSRGMPARFPTPLYLNLRSGAKPIDGFINIEGVARRHQDMWLDLRHGLPFPNESVDGIYTCHVFEHFYMTELAVLVKECHRVLKPGGLLRVLVPSVEKAIEAYQRQDAAFFSPFPRAFQSMGGKLYNFLLCEGQHRIIFDFSLMEELLRYAGFLFVEAASSPHSKCFDSTLLERIEKGYADMSLIVEAQK